MNYLAHFHLSFDDPMIMVGNMISDGVKGSRWKRYQPRVAKGILLHRHIDSFTDTHPIIKKMTAAHRPYSGKIAGAVTDILCDHLLIQNWAHFEEKTFDEYITFAYEVFVDRMFSLPIPYPKRLNNLVKHDWLNNYRTQEGMEWTLTNFSKYTGHPIDVDGLMPVFFEDNLEENVEQFRIFYGEMETYCRRVLASGF